ncbi:hypothetical protein, partial [Polynucleobacter sp. MWH-Tro8-2-5-gr]
VNNALGSNTTNTVNLSKAALGISNTTATYAGSTTIAAGNGSFALTGLVGSDVNTTASSGVINDANVASATKFTAVTLANGSQDNYAL